MNTVNPQGPSADLSTVDDSQKKFIELWGDMGAKWGVPRSMTELHALLYIMGIPLNTDEIMKLLSISRGNVSMTFYEGGHMMYMVPQALAKLKADAAKFYELTLKSAGVKQP